MLKYIIIASIIGVICFGLWFWNLSGPKQLNFADRWYPGSSEIRNNVIIRNIGYGSIDADHDSQRQAYDEYYPAGVGNQGDSPDCNGKKFPTLIFFHGGSWKDGEREDYGFVGRTFAARGFFTVIADYRKAPAHKFPSFVADAARAIAQVKRNIDRKPCADPDQIYVMGHSAGAHLAMMAALDPQWLVVEGMDTDIIKGVIGISGPYDFLPFESGGPAEDALGNWPRLEETQPITYVGNNAPPLLLLTGDADKTVRPLNSENLHKAIQDVEGKSELTLYPGLDHTDPLMAIARPFRGKARVIEDAVRFMQAYSRTDQ